MVCVALIGRCIVLCRAGNLSADIEFSSDHGPTIEFNWKDGKFDVTYDANDCTQSAKTFFDCMLPYLNDKIELKAKELNERK